MQRITDRVDQEALTGKKKGFFVDLRWYQGEAVDATWRHLCEVATNPLIVALHLGSGKSVIIAALVQRASLRAGGCSSSPTARNY